MLRRLTPTTLVVLLAMLLPPLAWAQTAPPDPAAFLPRGATIVKTVSGDVDGDGRNDLVMLYALKPPSSNLAHGGLLILLTTDDGIRPVQPFGTPPDRLRGEPTLDPNGSADLALQDLTGDGRPEIVLTVTNRFQEPRPRTLVWVFGAGMVPVPPDDDLGPPAPTWAGTGFKLEAFLEGSHVMLMSPAPGNPSPAYALRREVTDQRLGGPDPAVETYETFTWRNDGFRLAARSLHLPQASAGTARSPQAAVLSYYDAAQRGDIQTATALLGDELRASGAATLPYDPFAPGRQVSVEEIRLANEYLTGRMPPESDRDVYVRVSLTDSPDQSRHTVAGIWRVHKDGDLWQLISASLHETADLTEVADALPGGATPIETDGGDLRGRGAEDVVVLLTPPGRFMDVEPYVLFRGPSGFEPGVPLASFVSGGWIGGTAGSISVEDVNRDGTPEVTFSSIVGAHAALLWVLRWDGSTLAPLFAETSNSPVIGLEDLDGDGVAEIVLGQSGYCGGYATSPHLNFSFRWEDGAYRSASWRFPSLEDGIDEHAGEVIASYHGGDKPDDARVCIEHMLATAHAFRGRAADARSAYLAYAEHRQQLPDDTRRFVRPAYVPAPYFEADLRALLAAIDAGQLSGWGPPELAVIHDLLGDALSEQANVYQLDADSFVDRGKDEQAREARRKASEARQAATREYEAALTLDPTDQEARRAVGR